MSIGALKERSGQVNLRDKVGGIGGRLLYWEYADRTRKSMKWDIRSLAYLRNQWHGRALIICGGGPSLRADLPKIRELQRQGGYVLTVNKTHDYFLNLPDEMGGPIIPWAHMMLDPMPWVGSYVAKPHPHVKYFIASSCDPMVSRRLKFNGGEVYLYHAGADFYGAEMPTPILRGEFPNKPWLVVVGPTTVSLRAVVLGYELGFRPFHLFGVDSSMAQVGGADGEMKLHAYPKDRPTDADEGFVSLNTPGGKYEYFTNSHMSRQALDFQDLIESIGERVTKGIWEMIDVRVYGRGLLPAYAATIGLHGEHEQNVEYGGAKERAA